MKFAGLRFIMWPAGPLIITLLVPNVAVPEIIRLPEPIMLLKDSNCLTVFPEP